MSGRMRHCSGKDRDLQVEQRLLWCKGKEIHFLSRIGFTCSAVHGITSCVCCGLERRWSIWSKFEMDVCVRSKWSLESRGGISSEHPQKFYYRHLSMKRVEKTASLAPAISRYILLLSM